ncbi:NAD(P)H-binding protein [Sediminicola luteus]|uniref:NAD(P)-binding domain-containing protein n=1 Tax=Sediminicola luteus TaxID=319238 RepID=A0A2A4GCM4_9FLAO|nr:NAD(P)H-binding protein [Sediminicola luteus]PCE66213.1 hypothetical protein B7P33_02630 [Sediminicola luteus]
MQKIAILGCGWLGLPLAKTLIENKFSVAGSVSRASRLPLLSEAGILPYQVMLAPDGVHGNISGLLEKAAVLIIAVPPGLRKNPAGSFLQKMEKLLPHIKSAGIKNLLFVSSTSVYGDIPGLVTEATPTQPIRSSAQELRKVEQLLCAHFPNTTLVRMGGLIGPDRQPVRMLSGKTELKGRLWPVNLIHQADAVDLLLHSIEHQLWGRLFNGVYPAHPTKETYYQQQAERLQIPPPLFDLQDSSQGKQVDTAEVGLLEHFSFQHPI